jgi:hypothetical protein
MASLSGPGQWTRPTCRTATIRRKESLLADGQANISTHNISSRRDVRILALRDLHHHDWIPEGPLLLLLEPAIRPSDRIPAVRAIRRRP